LPWILSTLLPRKVCVRVNVRSLPSFLLDVPSRVKTGAERQSPLATVGSVVRVTFPFLTVNSIFRKAALTASCVVLPVYLPVFSATPAPADPGPGASVTRRASSTVVEMSHGARRAGALLRGVVAWVKAPSWPPAL
jgi:hypothetical protein